MISNIVFLKPILIHKDWGNNDLAQYGYKEDGIDVGELILLSDSEDVSNQIINTNFVYDDLNFLYKHNKKFFNSKTGSIPIAIKIINPKVDLDLMLSVDSKNTKYYSIKGNEIAQNKLWISLNKNKQMVVYNHKCGSKKNVEEFFLENLNDKYLNIVELDYLNALVINQNVINQIKQNDIIFEISCKNGIELNLNDLYQQELKKQTFDYLSNSFHSSLTHQYQLLDKENYYLANNQYFATKIINHVGLEYYNFKIGVITHVFVVEGEGKINSFSISTGSNFIIKNNVDIQIVGVLKMIVTHIFDK